MAEWYDVILLPNLKVKPPQKPPVTPVLVSTRVIEGLDEYLGSHSREGAQFLTKLVRMAFSGFAPFVGVDNKPIRPEWNGVYRIGIQNSRFRLFGFFEGDTKAPFIVIEHHMKRGQKLDAKGRAKVDKVAEVRKHGTYRKVESQESSDERTGSVDPTS